LYYHAYDEAYPGLGQRLAEAPTNAAMHLIAVHGIGNHSPGYSVTLGDGLARLLKLAKDTAAPPGPHPLVSSNGVTNWLTEYSYGNKRLVIHEVTWSPTTIGIKSSAFLKDQTLNAHRVLVNRDLKTNLMDEGLSDAVLYMNPAFRGAMQQPILQTIEEVASNTLANDVIVLVASSLGSKMTFDTVVEWQADPGVQHFTERTTDIIMLANQLPLLHLGTGTNLEAGAVQAPETAIKQFLRISRRHKQNRINKEGPPRSLHDAIIHVVAATDPNDLLSYPLSKRDIIPDQEDGTNVTITVGNIYTHNTGAILFVFANPAAAHDNYDLNEWLLKKLVYGYASAK
jgi:hypothetical protein